MKRKYYIAAPLNTNSNNEQTVKECREILKNLKWFFDIPFSFKDEHPAVTIVPPFEATEKQMDEIKRLLVKKLHVSKSLKLLKDEIAEFTLDEKKSFCWNFAPSAGLHEALSKLYEILTGYHIVLKKQLADVLGGLHCTLIRECENEDIYRKASGYIKLHFPVKATGALIIDEFVLYERNNEDTGWGVSDRYVVKK